MLGFQEGDQTFALSSNNQFFLSAKLVLDFENVLPGCAVMGNLIV